jgi:hypothetical protein
MIGMGGREGGKYLAAADYEDAFALGLPGDHEAAAGLDFGELGGGVIGGGGGGGGHGGGGGGAVCLELLKVGDGLTKVDGGGWDDGA